MDQLEAVVHNKPTEQEPGRKTKFDEYDEKLLAFQTDLTK